MNENSEVDLRIYPADVIIFMPLCQRQLWPEMCVFSLSIRNCVQLILVKVIAQECLKGIFFKFVTNVHKDQLITF